MTILTGLRDNIVVGVNSTGCDCFLCKKYNLGKVYISSASQPIEFNSESDDKSRFENVEHLEKYII